VAATLFHALGVDSKSHYRDLNDRRFAVSDGKPLLGVWR
jgi:hypothetical protein